jgi:O-antigen/teichoic acid export membrane protein
MVRTNETRDVNATSRDAHIRRRVAGSTVSNLIGKAVTLGVGLFLTPFIVHQLGDVRYGLWALVVSVVGYGSLLDLGIGSAVVKYVAEHRARGQAEEAHHLIGTALHLYAILALAAVGLSLLVAPIFTQVFQVPPEQRETARWLVVLVGIGVGVSIPAATPNAVLRGLQRYDLVNLLSIVGNLLSAAATVVVLLRGGGVLGMVAVSIAVTLVMLVPGVWLVRRVAPELRFGWSFARAGWPDRARVRTVLAYSSALFLSQTAGRLQRKTDHLVIGAALPISAITPYALALRLSELPTLVTDQLIKVFLPLASELDAQNDRARLRWLYLTGTRLTLALFVPIACVLIFLAEPILALWVGAEYMGSAHLVVILTLAGLVDISQWPAGALLQGMARHRRFALAALGTGIANLLLSIVLVRPLGLTGVALGTLIPAAFEALAFTHPYTMRIIGVSWGDALRRAFLPALLPALPMSALLIALGRATEAPSLLATLATACAGLLVYGVGYLAFGASAAERETYRTTLLGALRQMRDADVSRAKREMKRVI